MNLPKELMETIVEEVSKEFAKKDKVKKELEKDWRLRNTRYLLTNYCKLKSHCEITISSIQANSDNLKDIRVGSVEEYKAKTAKMMSYVDMMLKSYQGYCKSAGEASNRRWKVIDHKYLNTAVTPTNEALSERIGVDERTIRRDEKKAVEEFSVYLFGISHLTDLIEMSE